MTIRTRFTLVTIVALGLIVGAWGWLQLSTLDKLLVDQQGRRLTGLAETISHFYVQFPTAEGISAIDNALRDHLMLDGRLARLDILALSEDDIDHIAGASRIYHEWPTGVLLTARKKFQIHYVKVQTEEGPALGLLYPILPEKDRKTYVGVLSFSRSYREIYYRSRNFLLASLGALILLVTIILGIGYRLLMDRPLRAIIASMNRFAQGNYQERIRTVKPDELGILAAHFNSLANEIERVMKTNQEINLTLQERVDEGARKLVQVQKELSQMQKQSTLGYLTASFAHDLGTPLHSISGLARLLLEGNDLPDPVRRKLEIIVGQTDRLHAAITNIRRATRLPAPIFEKLSLADLFMETKALVEPEMKAQNIKLEVHCHPAVSITGDRYRLQTALINLIENAREALLGQGTIQVSGFDDPEGDLVVISVADDGPGIDAALKQDIWKPFITTHGEGLRGLGLSIVNDVVKEHDGSAKVESEPGWGTRISLFFPRTRNPASFPVTRSVSTDIG
jgi:signal transduction histidine kinase